LSGKYLANLTNRYDLLKSNQIQELFNLLDTTHQNERDIRFVKRIIKRRSILDFGKEPPKIELPNQNNELISHESYKGTFVLLEFWASWCGPCRETNPELIKVYNSFDRKDFEILGISQDKDLNKWKKAIKKDQLTWMQVIDTVNTSGKKYNMTTIPFNVLLDRNGKVIARELKPKKLAEVLQKRLEQEK
jgi:peroxiredoxin